MPVSVERRCKAALRRVNESIEERVRQFQVKCYIDSALNAAWLDARAVFYRRSIGQLVRFHVKDPRHDLPVRHPVRHVPAGAESS